CEPVHTNHGDRRLRPGHRVDLGDGQRGTVIRGVSGVPVRSKLTERFVVLLVRATTAVRRGGDSRSGGRHRGTESAAHAPTSVHRCPGAPAAGSTATSLTPR